MIKLQVESYCQDCPDFKPSKSTITYHGDDKVVKCDTIVECEHKDRCAAVAKFLQEK